MNEAKEESSLVTPRISHIMLRVCPSWYWHIISFCPWSVSLPATSLSFHSFPWLLTLSDFPHRGFHYDQEVCWDHRLPPPHFNRLQLFPRPSEQDLLVDISIYNLFWGHDCLEKRTDFYYWKRLLKFFLNCSVPRSYKQRKQPVFCGPFGNPPAFPAPQGFLLSQVLDAGFFPFSPGYRLPLYCLYFLFSFR